jgi:hypothetical protein
MVDRVLGHGVRVQAWTFDELYGRDLAFLDGLEERRQVFVGEVPTNFHGWVIQPQVLRDGPSPRRGRKKRYPRLARKRRSSEVQNLLRYSPTFRKQRWQRYRIKDTERGPEVWEVKWAVFWRKGTDGLSGRRHCLIVARHVLTGEVKYFVSNRVCRGSAASHYGGCCVWPLGAARWRVVFGRPKRNWGWTITKFAAGGVCIATST